MSPSTASNSGLEILARTKASFAIWLMIALNSRIGLMEENLDPRDHRVIGRELDLFTFSDTVGKGPDFANYVPQPSFAIFNKSFVS